MKNLHRTLVFAVGAWVFLNAGSVYAASNLLFRYNHHTYELNPSRFTWKAEQEVWTYYDRPISPRPEWRSDGEEDFVLPGGVVRSTAVMWDHYAIAQTLKRLIADDFYREAGDVTIARNASGAIAFDGIGMLGRSVDLMELVDLTIYALENDEEMILLPVEEIQPRITVLEPDLQDANIVEVVAVGESNFEGSPNNRKHNIAVGLDKFNGHRIAQGEMFSFNEILGPVNGATGYKQELVILGEKTLPDYGGGLCQVSTTAYRGVWEYGFPIDERRNHSFAVSYYGPQGTDATIYPPYTDMKFTNDGPSDLLIQTYVDESDNAYFIYYGLRDNRNSEIIGPYTWGHAAPPPEKTEYTTDIPPGTTRKVGSSVPGMKSAWFRIVTKEGEDPIEEGYYSHYEARPLFYQVGIEPGQLIPGSEPEEPTWLSSGSAEAPSTSSISNPRRSTERLNPRSIRRSR